MPQLDGLRFFAVLGVLVAHNWQPTNLPAILQILDGAALGVRLFFVLSGFLITGILLNARDLAETSGAGVLFYIRQFYARRFLRIFPIYYLTIAVVLILDFPPAREVWSWLVTYTTNLHIAHEGHWIGRVGHFWTLAVEEQFYLVWPWVVLFAPRRWLIGIMSAIVVSAPLYRYFTITGNPGDFRSGLYTSGTHTLACLDSLGVGALLALVYRTQVKPDTVRKWLTRAVLPAGIAIFAGVNLLLYYSDKPRAYFTLADLGVALAACWLVDSAARGFRGPVGALLEFKPLIYLGKISYGLYVYHNLVPPLIASVLGAAGIVFPETGFASFIISTAVTIALSALSWRLIELPANSLKRYFDYRDLAMAAVK